MDMPVLNKIIDSILQENFNGKETIVLHVNHCMDNSFYFSEAMKRLFYEVIFIGVPYNANEVNPNCTFRYYYGKNKKNRFELYQGKQLFHITDCGFSEATELLIDRALQKEILPLLQQGKKLLIIEDGGYHYPVVRRLLQQYPFLQKQILGSVEQTTSGTVKCVNNYRKNEYLYPCTSIARSDIKMHVESRFIGHRVIEELSNFLYTANTFLDFHNVLILGYGIVGRRIAKDLQEKQCNITIYDTDDYIAGIARREGFQTASVISPNHFPKSTILIGNTGEDSFTFHMLTAFLKSSADTLYLASSSSQDREFRTFLDMIKGLLPYPEGLRFLEEVSADYFTIYHFLYQERPKTIYLIAQGLPVNFYRKDVISLTHSMIDLIFSEMLSMGISLCRNISLKPGLYLLGADEGFMPYLTEEELIHLWFNKYDLSWGNGIPEILDCHPGSDHLRYKLSRRI